jgi:hypothetical protein
MQRPASLEPWPPLPQPSNVDHWIPQGRNLLLLMYELHAEVVEHLERLYRKGRKQK